LYEQGPHTPATCHSGAPDWFFQPAGTVLNVIALVLFGVSNSKDFNALPYAAVILGLGGITFHLAQFHISNLFPRNRGLISSLFVAGFTGCGIIFYFLDLIFNAAGSTRWVFLVLSHSRS
jgi:hypothetical protein